VPSAPSPTAEPLVAVIIPALNEAGKIGRVLDKLPRDGRFEAIVVDDGSTDGTGDEARAHGAAVVLRHEVRGGVGAAIRDGWQVGLQRGRPYLALLSGDDQHEPAELVPALDRLLETHADYLQGSRWMRGGRVDGPSGGRGFGTRLYSLVFSILVLRRITDASAARLHPFVLDAVAPGSVVRTDGWEGYTGLAGHGYTHEVTPLRQRKGAAAELLPRVHHVVALLKRWLMGTHHGAVSPAHLDYYLDEFTFRFNRRRARHRGLLFYRLLEQAVELDHVPLTAIVGGRH